MMLGETIPEIQALVDDYAHWLRDRTTLRGLDGWVEITTPYLDRHNDYLQIYVGRSDNGGLVITDDGYTIADLEQSGCGLDTGKRKDLLQLTLNGFGVRMRDKALSVEASETDFPLRKHNLVQSMLAINDLFYLASPAVASLFLEDVLAWLDDAEIRYTQNVKFTGRSGYDHRFDFVIPKSRGQPERIVRAVNRPTRDSAQSVAFAWLDTKGVRPSESHAYAIVNDSDGDVSANVLAAMRNYDVTSVRWSERGDVLEKLTA